MATQTLRPNATLANAGWTRNGGGTDHGVLSDDSDSTSIESTSFNKIAKFDLTTYTLAAGERVNRYRVRVRTTSYNARLDYRARDAENAVTGAASSDVSSASGPTNKNTITGPWLDDIVSTATSQQAWIAALQLWLEAKDNGLPFSGDPLVYEGYLDLDVWARTAAPTVAITEESGGSVTDTDRPTIESSTSALNDGTPGQWTRQVRVFRDAVYLGGGFDPADESDVEWEDLNTTFATPSVDSGAPDTIQVGSSLANNDNYRAYVRYGKNSVAGQTLWSEWSYAGFTLTVTLPTAPAIAVTVEPTEGRQEVVVTPAALTYTSIDRLEIQRSDDGGTTWAQLRDGVVTDSTPSSPYTVYDYDAPRDTALEYRVRTIEVTAGGGTVSSAWATDGPVTHDDDGSWWLFDVDDWTRIVAGARIVENPDEVVGQEQGVFRPLGRETAVVVQGEVHGHDGTYALRATGTDEVAAVAAIAKFAGTVLVKSPFGWQRYVRWVGDRGLGRQGTPTNPRTPWTLAYVEVDDGLGD